MVVYKCAILADPKSRVWEFAKEIYTKISAKSDQFSLNQVHINKFRDGEIKPKIEDNVRKHNCFFIHDSSKPPTEWLTELVLVNNALQGSSANEVTNVLPYLRFARQDRKDETRVPISARVVADMIGLYADRVVSIDVHNPALQGFYNIPFDNLLSFSTVIKYLRANHPDTLEDVMVMSPDAGGTERASALSKKLGGTGDIAVGYKRRVEAGKVADLKILGDVRGKNVFVVDDIIDSGGTLVKACEALKDGGARNVYAYATHGIFTKGTEHLTACFDKVFVSDTLIRDGSQNGVEVIPFAPLFAEAIYRIHMGESLSQLFDGDYSL
jgi:ribose-phosphate pyrophosphokinase